MVIATPPAKVFRPPHWRVSIGLGMGIAAIGAATAFSQLLTLLSSNSAWYLLLVGLLLCAVGSAIALQTFNSQFIVTPTYLEYQSWKYRLRVKWADLKEIRWPIWDFGRAWNAERIVIRASASAGSPEIKGYIESNVLGDSIPIGYFDAYWRKSELGREIFKRAPQLRRRPHS